MRLRSLLVKQLSGVPDGRLLDAVQDGVTMLIGPNASGKSRLATALQTVLDPTAASKESPVVTATFESDGVTYTAQRTGGGLTWTRDGQQVEPPIAPQDAARHFVHLKDLMSLDGPNREVLERMQVELAGGFDLHKLRETIGAQPAGAPGRKQPGGKEASALADALANIEALQKKRRDLEHDERNIETLREEQARLKAQAGRKEALGAALDWLEADAQRSAAQANLDAVPHAEVYSKASDSVWNEVIKALDDLNRAEQATSHKRSVEQQARIEVDRLDLSDVTLEQVDGWLEEVAHLAQLEDGIDRQRQDRDAKVARAQREAGFASGTPTELNGRAAEPDEAVRLIEAFEQLDRLRAVASISTHDEADRQQHAQAAILLTRWLRLTTHPALWASSSVAALGSSVGAALLLSVGQTSAAALVGLSGLMPLATATVRTLLRWRAQQAFTRLAVDKPSEWTARDVREAWRLHAEQAHRQEASAQNAAELNDAERTAFALATSLGIAPDALSTQKAYRWTFLTRAQAARAEAEQAQDALDAQEAAAQTARQRLRSVLPAIEGLPDEGAPASDWRAYLKALRAKAEHAKTARDTLQRAELEREAAEAFERDVHARLIDLHTSLSVSDNDTDDVTNDLRTWTSGLPVWNDARTEERDAHARAEQARQTLEARASNDTELQTWLAAHDMDAIKVARDACDQANEESDKVFRQILETEREVERLASSDERASLEMAAQQARDTLQAVYDDAVAADLAAAVVDDISGVQTGRRTPQLLQAAKANFERFTHHRYELRVNTDAAGRPEPALIDRSTGTDLPFDLLSTGTSAQLLLALRTASLPRSGEGLGFPLVLDEALTTSDPDRFAAVASALADVAETHQILYLSSREEDARLWAAALHDAEYGGRVPHVRYMEDLNHAATPDWSVVSMPERKPIPAAPSSDDWREYAASLAVPAADPRTPNRTHVLFLLPDRLEDVHTLVTQGVEDLGQLSGAARDNRTLERLIGREGAASIQGRLHALQGWLQDLAESQPQPVTAEHLQESGAVSETFFGRVWEKTEEVGRDGRMLINALEGGEVKGFRKDAMAALASHLEAAGCILDSDAQDPSEAHPRALVQLQESGATAAQARWLLDVWNTAIS